MQVPKQVQASKTQAGPSRVRPGGDSVSPCGTAASSRCQSPGFHWNHEVVNLECAIYWTTQGQIQDMPHGFGMDGVWFGLRNRDVRQSSGVEISLNSLYHKDCHVGQLQGLAGVSKVRLLY